MQSVAAEGGGGRRGDDKPGDEGAGAPAPTDAGRGWDEVVTVNVGGDRFTTTRATLCQAEGSALAALFSPRWFRADGGEALPRDREGVPFLDYDPACFRLLLAYLRQRRLAAPDAVVAPPTVPRELQGAWALFVDYLGVGDFMAEGGSHSRSRSGQGEGGGGCGAVASSDGSSSSVAAARAGEQEEGEEEEGGMMIYAAASGAAAGPWAAPGSGGGGRSCSVAPLVFDVVSKGVTAVPDGSAAFMVYSHDVYGFAACSKPLASGGPHPPTPHAWRCRVTLSLTAPRAALSLSLGVIGGGLGQAAAAAFPAAGLSSNGAEGGCVHGQRSFIPRADAPGGGGWRDGFRDGDEVVMRLHPSERCLELAVLRAGGAVRACAYRLGLPELPAAAVPAAACSKGSPAAAGAGAAGAGVGAAGPAMGRDRWFFCCYLSNGVGIDLLPTTPEEVDYALASL